MNKEPVSREGELINLFLRKKPVMMMVKLNSQKEMYASVLAKQVDCTYSHTVRVIQDLKSMKLVNFTEKGRIKLIGLTKKGKDIAEAFQTLLKTFETD
ncbi:MAG: winged helix DNA-binding protein [Candidatus Nanoarchaeia archaeon]|nr:winged helix DNA-binding protein [Candidatus Nanoarchaeia archaeon]